MLSLRPGLTLALSFAEPALLGGLLLVGVPLILHWLFRRPEREERWAAMEILRRAIARRSVRQRLQTLLLLIVRMLMIAAIVLAVARPRLESASIRGPSQTPTRRTLILDTSLSMSSREQAETPLAAAKALAHRIVDSATAGDAFRILKIAPGKGSPMVVRNPSSDVAAIGGEIDRLAVTDGRGDPVPALSTMVDWIADSSYAGPREVIVLSDFQRSNWTDGSAGDRIPGLLEAISRRARLILIPVGDRRVENLSVSQAHVKDGMLRTGSPLRLEATLTSESNEARPAVAVETRVNGTARGVTRVDVPAGEAVIADLSLTLEAPGLTPVDVALPDDRLPGDDHAHQVLTVRDRLRVLLVDQGAVSRGESRGSDYVRLALDPRGGAARNDVPSWFEVRTIGAIDLQRENLSAVDAVVLCGVPRLTAEEGRRLEEFARAGGGLIVAASSDLDVINTNERLYRDGNGPLPTRLVDWFDGSRTAETASTLTLPPQPHPVLDPFVGNPDAGLTTTRVWSFARVEGADAPVLSLADGTPVVLEKSLGRGRCLLVTTSLDDRSSNWALWPSFLPVVQEMTQYAAAAGDPRSVIAGDPIEFWPPSAGPFEVRNPRGEVILRQDVTATDTPVRVEQTDIAGIYSFRPAGRLTAGDSTAPAAGSPLEQLAAVNADPVESRLDRLTHDELHGLLGSTRHVLLTDWQPIGGGDGAGASPVNELAGPLMAIVLALALVEGALAWKFVYGVGLLAAVIAAAAFWLVSGPAVAAAAGLLAGAAAMVMTVRQKWT